MRKTPIGCLLHKGAPWLNGNKDLTNASNWKISAPRSDQEKKEYVIDGVGWATLHSSYCLLCRTHKRSQELKYKYKQLWEREYSKDA